MGWGVAVTDCTFLSTEEDKIICFEDCPFYKEEGDNCPFKNTTVIKKGEVKDYSFDYLYEEEIATLPFPEVYSKEYD